VTVALSLCTTVFDESRAGLGGAENGTSVKPFVGLDLSGRMAIIGTR
jgi:hypothetical protein